MYHYFDIIILIKPCYAIVFRTTKCLVKVTKNVYMNKLLTVEKYLIFKNIK